WARRPPLVHVPLGRSAVMNSCPSNLELDLAHASHWPKGMQYSRTQIGITVGAGVLLVFGFFGYLIWLNNQGPVLARAEERDQLSRTPNSVRRDRTRDRGC